VQNKLAKEVNQMLAKTDKLRRVSLELSKSLLSRRVSLLSSAVMGKINSLEIANG
jgi:hypothetical protein